MPTIEDARSRLPLDVLMPQYGHDVPRGGKSSFRCPICQKKSKANLKNRNGRFWFKCFSPDCPSTTSGPGGAWDEVKFIGWKLGLSTQGATGQYSEAAIHFMKEAGVWKEKVAIPASTLPGATRRNIPPPKPPAAPPTEEDELIQECIVFVQAEGKASVSMLQRRFRVGYGRASRIIGELEQRGIVGPARGAEAREVLVQRMPLPAPVVAPAVASAENVPASSAPAQAPLDSQPDTRGAGEVAVPTSALPQITAVPANVTVPVVDAGLVKPVVKEKDPTGVLAMREYYEALPPLSDRDRETVTLKRGLTTVTMEALGLRSNPRTNKEIIERLTAERGMKEMLAAGLWLPADRKRKLPQRINTQFCGKGQVGKIPKAERKHANDKIKWGWSEPILIPYFNEKGEITALRPHKGGAPATTALGGKSLYIPRAGAPNAVFRRLVNGNIDDEKFETVVVTEGEFKAMALWQTVGHGARQFLDAENNPVFREDEAMGVCAVPGITYAKHFETREILEDWLRVVGCRHVIIAFDYEEKSNPENYPDSFEPERRKRYETQVYARFLAVQLQKKLPLRASTCVLPPEWLNEKGKADWDGALADLVNKEEAH